MARTRQGDILKAADVMLEGVGRNEVEPKLASLAFQLGQARTAATEALGRRATNESQAQQASRDLDAIIVTVKVLFSRMSRMLQGIYGPREEKLAEFGLKPLRPAQKPKVVEKPPEQARSATQAAAPMAESTE